MSPNNPDYSQQSGFQMPRPGSKPGGGSGGSHGEEEENSGPEYLSDIDVVELDNEKQLLQVEEILERLDRELVGLVPIKTRIREIASLLLVDTLRRRFGLASTRPTLHMCFTGSPGTGKTTVAMRMAELLHGLGYLRKDHMVAVTRDDIVGQYVGHTAPKTKEVLKRAAGGVLFIDEAYYLYREDNERDYGQEAIEILLQVMENQRDDLVVILAGYKDKMDSFFQSNPGMASRIAHHMDFPDYTLDELMGITDLILEDENYIFPEETQEAFREYMELRMEQPRFANARSVRNALDRARLRQANRLVDAGGEITKKDVMTIEAEDIRKSRVFSDSDLETAEDGIDQVEDVGEPEKRTRPDRG